MRLSELPPQTARDLERDEANIERVEKAAAAGGLVLRHPERSDMHIKWIVSRDSAIPGMLATWCEVVDHGTVKIIMLPRSHETMYIRWVDTVPYLTALLALASAGIWALFMFRASV